MIILGLTGPIGSGKSTVAAALAARGADVIDCDRLAREATVPGSRALQRIVERFGPTVLQADGSLDRAAVGRRVFGDAAAMGELEGLVHPEVTRAKDARLAASTAAVAVIEAIKLVEAGYAAECDAVWVVTAAPQVRLRRLIEARSMDEATARQRIDSQTNFPVMLAAADRVIRNDGTREELNTQLEAAWLELLRPGASDRSGGSM